jgi:hypothetical protein
MGIAGLTERLASPHRSAKMGTMVHAVSMLANAPDWVAAAFAGAVALLLASALRRTTGAGGA